MNSLFLSSVPFSVGLFVVFLFHKNSYHIENFKLFKARNIANMFFTLYIVLLFIVLLKCQTLSTPRIWAITCKVSLGNRSMSLAFSLDELNRSYLTRAAKSAITESYNSKSQSESLRFFFFILNMFCHTPSIHKNASFKCASVEEIYKNKSTLILGSKFLHVQRSRGFLNLVSIRNHMASIKRTCFS